MKFENLKLNEVEIDSSNPNFRDAIGMTADERQVLVDKLSTLTKTMIDEQVKSKTEIIQRMIAALTAKEALLCLGISFSQQYLECVAINRANYIFKNVLNAIEGNKQA